MEGQKDPIAPPIDLEHPEANSFLRYALDLFNYEYFWESHVYFEALWNTHGREGSVSDFLKGMIKLGAAGVKTKVEQLTHAREHFLRAKELFTSVKEAEGVNYLGFDLNALISQIDAVLSGDKKELIIYPLWE